MMNLVDIDYILSVVNNNNVGDDTINNIFGNININVVDESSGYFDEVEASLDDELEDLHIR